MFYLREDLTFKFLKRLIKAHLNRLVLFTKPLRFITLNSDASLINRMKPDFSKTAKNTKHAFTLLPTLPAKLSDSSPRTTYFSFQSQRRVPFPRIASQCCWNNTKRRISTKQLVFILFHESLQAHLVWASIIGVFPLK